MVAPVYSKATIGAFIDPRQTLLIKPQCHVICILPENVRHRLIVTASSHGAPFPGQHAQRLEVTCSASFGRRATPNCAVGNSGHRAHKSVASRWPSVLAPSATTSILVAAAATSTPMMMRAMTMATPAAAPRPPDRTGVGERAGGVGRRGGAGRLDGGGLGEPTSGEVGRAPPCRRRTSARMRSRSGSSLMAGNPTAEPEGWPTLRQYACNTTSATSRLDALVSDRGYCSVVAGRSLRTLDATHQPYCRTTVCRRR